MKKLIAIILFALQIQCAFAQLQIPVDTATGKISYTEIIYVDSASKKELIGRTVEWVALSYKSANDVIQLNDEERGKMIVKGLFKKTLDFGFLTNAKDVSVYHTIKVDFKNGKCKIQMTDFNYKYYNDGTGTLYKGWIEENFETQIKQLSTKKNFAYKEEWLAFFKSCDSEIRSTLNSFSEHLQKAAEKKAEDW